MKSGNRNTAVDDFEQFRGKLAACNHPLLPHLTSSECSSAVLGVREYFSRVAACKLLPYPVVFNADLTLATLAYGIVRYRRPKLVLEAGVGYGITSALILAALQAEGAGRLISLDLASLSDVKGAATGLAVPECYRNRWLLYTNAGSRKHLATLGRANSPIDVFMSDSANVYTLQRFEFGTVWPHLREGGLMLFNNIGARFLKFLSERHSVQIWQVAQAEKAGCVTALIEKKAPAPTC